LPSTQFFGLSQERQQNIIQVSLREFALYGYDVASTNRIVKEAGISKGVLFKYFDSKDSLFLYICELAITELGAALPIANPESVDDPFAWLVDLSIRKITYSIEHPLTYQLLMRVAKQPKHEVYAKIMHRAVGMSQALMSQLAARLPTQRLRTGVTWERVFAIVNWVAQGLEAKYFASIPDVISDDLSQSFQPLINELEFYFEMIKSGIYRQEVGE